jgi:hypothetical protein
MLGACGTRIQPRAHDALDQQCRSDTCNSGLYHCKPARWDLHPVTAGSASSLYPRAVDSGHEFARGVRVRAADNASFPCVTELLRGGHGYQAWGGSAWILRSNGELPLRWLLVRALLPDSCTASRCSPKTSAQTTVRCVLATAPHHLALRGSGEAPQRSGWPALTGVMSALNVQLVRVSRPLSSATAMGADHAPAK